MAIADIFGQYVDKRLQGIEDRYNQASGLLSGDSDAWAAQFGLETEEEKRKRREREQQQQDLANVVVTSTKVDTYGDGSQTETVKREIPAAVAPEDIAPAAEPAPMLQTREEPMQAQVQTAPAALAQAAPAPQAQPQRQPGQPGQIVYNQPAAQAPAAPAPAMAAPAAAPQAQPMAQTQAMPAAPVQAVAPAPAPAPAMAPPAAAPAAPIAPGAQAPAMPQLPQPGPPVQVASTMPGAGVAEAAAAAQAAQAAPEPAWMAAANEAGNNFDKLVDVIAKFPEAKDSLKQKMEAALDTRRKSEEAQKIVLDAAQGDLKAQNKLQQALRPEKGRAKEEVTTSDYVKAYLYARLGLNELASEVQKKIIGKDTKFSQVQVGNTMWQVETDSRGNIVAAKDDEGNVATESTLNKLRATGMKTGGQVFGFTGGSATIPAGQPDAGQEYRQRTNSQTGAIENIITTGPNAGKVYSGPPGLEKRVETSAAVALNDAQIKFQTAPTIAAATTMMELAGKADRGDGKTINSTLAQIQRMSPQIFRQIQPLVPSIVGTPAGAGAATTTGGAVTTTGGATGGGAVTTTGGATGGGAVTTTGGGVSGVGGGRSLGEQVAQQAANIDIAKAGAISQIETKEDLEKKLNVFRVNQPAAEGNADRMVRTLNDIMTHPGLDKTIGNPDLLNKPLQMIPQGDRRAFKQKYDQLRGQEFLAAYDQLKGGGGISEIEGAKAEQAISALKDTGISPEEFKKNAWILRDAVESGIDNRRRQLGQPPKYAGTPEQEQAKAWLRNNPNHPKAAAVRKKLVGF